MAAEQHLNCEPLVLVVKSQHACRLNHAMAHVLYTKVLPQACELHSNDSLLQLVQSQHCIACSLKHLSRLAAVDQLGQLPSHCHL